MHLIRVTSHLGVKTPANPKPSTTHSCESSKAPQKTLLLKRPDGGQVTARCKGLVEVLCTFSPYHDAGEKYENRPQEPSTPSRRNCVKSVQKPLEQSQNMNPLSNQALRKKSGPLTCRVPPRGKVASTATPHVHSDMSNQMYRLLLHVDQLHP